VNTPKDADVIPKDPKEYIIKLKHFTDIVKTIEYN
jgi:hypothetical protein